MAKAKEWKWGYINKKGEFVIEPRFDGAADFHEGLASVNVDWARGYIDMTGKWVIEPRFGKAGNFSDGVARVTLDGEVHYIDREGNFVSQPVNEDTGQEETQKVDESLFSTYFEVGPYSEGLARVQKSSTSKWGYINEEGKYVIRPAFRQAGDFHEGLARVLTSIP